MRGVNARRSLRLSSGCACPGCSNCARVTSGRRSNPRSPRFRHSIIRRDPPHPHPRNETCGASNQRVGRRPHRRTRLRARLRAPATSPPTNPPTSPTKTPPPSPPTSPPTSPLRLRHQRTTNRAPFRTRSFRSHHSSRSLLKCPVHRARSLPFVRSENRRNQTNQPRDQPSSAREKPNRKKRTGAKRLVALPTGNRRKKGNQTCSSNYPKRRRILRSEFSSVLNRDEIYCKSCWVGYAEPISNHIRWIPSSYNPPPPPIMPHFQMDIPPGLVA